MGEGCDRRSGADEGPSALGCAVGGCGDRDDRRRASVRRGASPACALAVLVTVNDGGSTSIVSSSLDSFVGESRLAIEMSAMLMFREWLPCGSESGDGGVVSCAGVSFASVEIVTVESGASRLVAWSSDASVEFPRADKRTGDVDGLSVTSTMATLGIGVASSDEFDAALALRAAVEPTGGEGGGDAGVATIVRASGLDSGADPVTSEATMGEVARRLCGDGERLVVLTAPRVSLALSSGLARILTASSTGGSTAEVCFCIE